MRREGRITAAQRRALDELWPRFGLEPGDQELNLAQAFGRAAPCALEIGFGMGTSLVQLAERHPERNFIGIEVHRPGVGNLLRLAAASELTNIRVICADAVEVLQKNVPDAALDEINIFFPDPWPKKRHHKRRLIQPEFAALACRKLQPGGLLHVATDWENYAQHILGVLDGTPGLANAHGQQRFAPHRAERPLTKFEQRGLNLGHGVWDLIFTRTA